jgi:Fur family ferric uptake transcriptional regulator
MSWDKQEKEARDLLQQAKGRITPVRLNVLTILLASEAALGHQEIEQIASEQGLRFDRVTLYRTLDWLLAQGIVHKINGIDRHWRYGASADSQHAHFHCKKCHRVFCLENPQPILPASYSPDYQIEQAELNLQGCCPKCR